MELASKLGEALAALAELTDRDRLLRVEVAGAGLVVERFTGYEAVCGPFRFEIDVLSTDAFIGLETLLEQPVRLHLRRADNGERDWHGYCTQARRMGSDGGLARYRLVVEPWTAFLTLRRNALIFQDMDTRAIVEQVLSHYAVWGDYRFEVSRALPVRSITTQYRESDADFVWRLLAEAGLAWRYEHVQGGDEGGHTLVIYDDQASRPDVGLIRFHRVDATELRDAIVAFNERREVVPTSSVTGSWQTEQLVAVTGHAEADAGAGPALEVFVQPRSGRYAEAAEAAAEARYRLEGLRVPQVLHTGAGSARELQAGAQFTLTQHRRHEGEAFVPLAICHVAVNNLGSGIAQWLPGGTELELGSYRNRFVSVPSATPLSALWRPRPRVYGPMVATVVGVPEATVTSSRDHQVRIQFSWQRGETPNRGGFAVDGEHAPGDHTTGTWVPVLERVAGPNWGGHFLPRIGSEVVVEFQHGDLDQPRVVGQLYNGEVPPPFAGGIDGPSNHPGTLSGLHSLSHDGTGTQQWVLDDTPGQLRTRLHTTLGDSRLELGYLIDHQDTQRGGYRGLGFELGTQGWANIHAAEGLLLSSTLRENGRSTQLDIDEAVAQLKGAERTAQHLSETLQGQSVPVFEGNEWQTLLREAIDAEALGRDGHHYKPELGRREASDRAVERFVDARLIAESPDRVALTTPKSGVAYAGKQLHMTSQSDWHLASGQTIAGVSGAHGALYAHAGPVRLIAANGPVTLQSNTGSLEVLADRSVTVTATDEQVEVLAQGRIVLQAGDSQVVLQGGDITFSTPGEFRIKASLQPFNGGVSQTVVLDRLPDGRIRRYRGRFIVLDEVTGEPIINRPYCIVLANGDIEKGVTDARGYTHLVMTADEEIVRIEVEE